MSESGLYRLTKGGHSRKEGARFRHYQRGDEIVLTGSEALAMSGRVQFIEPMLATASEDSALIAPSTEEVIESPDKIQPPAAAPRVRRSPRGG